MVKLRYLNEYAHSAYLRGICDDLREKVMLQYVDVKFHVRLNWNVVDLPYAFAKRRLYWRAEEFQKFAFPVMEDIFFYLISPKGYHLVQLIARITELAHFHRDGL